MKKILIVEDDTYLANAYRVKLTKAGFEVKNVFDGEEAISILQTFTPDIILLDIVMPKKDGFTTLEEIKANEKWKNIPVILASNLGQKEDREKGISLGAVEFFTKTDFTLNNLIEKINSISPPQPQQKPS
jgi:DNA-binding response OmpR family regulator